MVRCLSARPTASSGLIVFPAIAVSVVHYTDNYTAYEAYPTSDSPAQSLAGPDRLRLVLLHRLRGRRALLPPPRQFARRRHQPRGLLGKRVSSASGIMAAGGTGDFPWWRHGHIVADILLGVAVFASALYLVRRERSGADRARPA